MAVDDTPPPPNTTDKIIPFSILNKVPIKLDLEKHNYNSWSSFSLIHLGSLGLKSHVETDTASINPEWCQLDDLIKMWILSSLYLFHDNKDVRALNLDNELRSIKIGKMTVNEYCTQIQSMMDRLKNLGCVVSDKNLVIYTVNGIDSRFATLVEIICHRKTFPSFENVRTMLLLKESSFNDDSGSSTDFASSSSSPTVLLASNPSNNKGNPNKPSNLPQLCNHFNKGTCSQGILGAAPALHPSQATSLPSAFSTMTLSDPTWNMDTDNNCTIEFDAFGFSVKDFLTRHVLLRCDSSGNLSPVTKPSIVPAAFVSTSSSTWHQRLGHPGDDVFHSLFVLILFIRIYGLLLLLVQVVSRVYHTFHVSNLKKCYADEPLVMPLEGIHVDDKLQFVEEPVEIMEREIKRLKRSRIPLVKVRWNSRRGPEFTWECEDSFKQKYPQLFTNRATSSTTRS
ncbi:hypothetical protein Tco_1047565 [Tanacetum coccineum]